MEYIKFFMFTCKLSIIALLYGTIILNRTAESIINYEKERTDFVPTTNECFSLKKDDGSYRVQCKRRKTVPTRSSIDVNCSLVSELILTGNMISSLPPNSLEHFSELELLDLSMNPILRFGNDSFSGLGNLKILKITQIQIIYILKQFNMFKQVYFEKRAFHPVTSIEELNFYNTVVDFNSLCEALCSIRNGVKTLNLTSVNHNEKLSLDSKHTRCLNKLNLKKLSLDSNHINDITSSATVNMKHLEYLSLRNNNIGGPFRRIYLVFMHNLKYLDIGCAGSICHHATPPPWQDWIVNNTYIRDYPLVAAELNVVNGITPLYTYSAMSNLQTVKMDYTTYKLYTQSGGCWINNSLVNLDCSFIREVQIEGPILCMNHLRFLNIRGIFVYLSFNYNSFYGMNSLEVLLLGSSRLTNRSIFSDVMAPWMFKNNVNLKFLDLSDLKIETFHEKLFKPLKKLEVLILSKNKLKEINLRYLNFDSLKYIDFSYNKLLDIPVDFLFELEKHNGHKKHIRLTGNPFLCNCSSISKLKFVLRNSSLNIDKKHLNCMLDDKRSMNLISALKYLESKCQRMDKICMVFLGFFYPFILLIIMISSLIYRYRWKFLYAWYYTTLHWNKQEENLQNYMFDAFIAYSNADEKWVREVLVKSLESGRVPYSLCLHYRSFLPGEYIADNIISSIKASRKTILVMTKKFVKSAWCQFECRAAEEHHLTNHKRGIVAIVFPGVHTLANSHSHLCGLLNNVTYLEWNKQEAEQAVFWIRLRKALGSPGNLEDNLRNEIRQLRLFRLIR